LIKINYYIDTTFACYVKKALNDNIDFPIDTAKLRNYLIPESFFKKNEKACNAYKKIFKKDGFPKGQAILYYNWGEHAALFCNLINSYSIIVIDDLLGAYIYRKPCCSSKK
jgi:hypothetical protein